MMNLQTLVLNADYRPLSYHPLSLWSWRDALTALMLDRVALVANYDVRARSPSRSMPVPSVVALKRYKHLDGTPPFTRYNIYLRDAFTCQYCASEFSSELLTFDHVIPRSRGGRTTWENVVAACAGCNHVKRNRTPYEARMPLLKEPRRPTRYELSRRAPDWRYRDFHHTWLDYLYWDSELDA
jgi:5-methylcytosine-specific restriction endonuclease McrA